MDDLELFNYRNLFPLNRTSSFLLTLMYLCPFPFSRISLLYILKSLHSDKEASALLNSLVKEGYLYRKQGYYALTSKSVIQLDIYKEKAPHRKRDFSIESLSIYEIKSFIVAQALFNAVAPVIRDTGHFPKNETERNTLIQCMIDQIQSKSVPFLKGHNLSIYKKTISKTRYLREYEINSLYLSKLYTKLNAAAIKAKTNMAEAKNYERINNELNQVKKALEKAAPLCQMLTYTDGLKILTLAILEQNNLFIEDMTSSSISIGIINSATNSMTNYQLKKKLDYAVTFSAFLGLELSVSIYTPQTYIGVLKNRMNKLKAPFILPPITVKPVPQKLSIRSAYLKEILEEK